MKIKIITKKVDDLIPYVNNARTHSEEQVSQIASSIKEFGFNNPILLDGDNGVVAGHGRLLAAKKLGLEEVPCIELSHLSGAKKRAYILADNKLALNAGWDYNLLNIEVESLLKEQMDLNTIGFSDDELNEILNNAGEILDGAPNSNTPNNKYYENRYTNGALQERFVVPPFSVLDTRQDYWQNRKREWLELTGNLSETRNTKDTGAINGGSRVIANINEGTSNFDPVLAEIMYKWFAPDNGKILDPFGGEQTKGVVAGELGYHYTAVEFRGEQVILNQEKTKQYPNIKYFQGDSNNIKEIIKERGFDLCFTSPPYYDLEIYSKDDLSALGTYEEFLQQYENIFRQCFEMLDDNAFLVVKIGEIRDKKTGIYRNFVGDNITIFKKIGFHYYNELILLNSTGTAAVRANNCMRKRKMVKIHQNVLVFFKGDIDKLVKKLPSLNYATDEETQESEENQEQKSDLQITAIDGKKVFNAIKPIYEAFGNADIPQVIHCPQGMENFIAAASQNNSQIISDKADLKAEFQTINDKKVLLAYTGGKDSVAATIRLKKAGYDVSLFFIKGLNKAYPKELDCAEKIAEILGCKLYVSEVKITGKNSHPDNPVKNQLILSLMTDFGLKHGFNCFSSGILNVTNPNYEFDWSDSGELMETFKAFMRKAFKGWKYIENGATKEAENLAELLKHPKAKELWNLKSSCVGPNRFRSTHREANEAKFKIKLSENQCGSCYKCAYEYVVKSALTTAKPSVGYLRKCMEILRGDKAKTYDITEYSNGSEWAKGTFGQEIGERVIELCKKQDIEL